MLGNRRLSIIDIAGGHQPFVSDDGQVALVQNGEIFNYVELAAELRAQGVPAAHRLRHRGDAAPVRARGHRASLRRLNGMFAIAIDDAREDALYLVRDRIGVKPLYWPTTARAGLFGSEIKAMLPVPRARRSAASGPGGDPPLPDASTTSRRPGPSGRASAM